MTTKEQILKSLEQLPDDATYEDAMERLYVLYKIQRGLQQADEGKTMTHAEVRERMAKWLR
jgi:predicted transcriptional regulator